ncbi:hypothetical protein CHS0354_025337 [Potamilus streckersoni]|uniref:ETFB lysine methyltransferase n=1 Tax=Potamilus streckersoni TaxID=2493646 RepID=A0AAE0SPG0_9BIVA|nr:hypothetical protein CHS0354_025337 [Potamilus streckersoni]
MTLFTRLLKKTCMVTIETKHLDILSRRRLSVSQRDESVIKSILENTELTINHMTPEIKLHLITPRCPMWKSKGDNLPFSDPYWAFYWPGGQVLSRFILDNSELFVNRTVLDVGSGCGASAIACRLVGAKRVVANDTDPVALIAVGLNATRNKVALEMDNTNLIGELNPDWSTVLLGDMFYDENFATIFSKWLPLLVERFGTDIFIGDPGRYPLKNHPVQSYLVKQAEYELPLNTRVENNGMTHGFVWKYVIK